MQRNNKNSNERIADIQLFTLADVSEKLKVSQRTLINYINGGHIKATKIGGMWRITETELRRVVSEGVDGAKPTRTPKRNKGAFAADNNEV